MGAALPVTWRAVLGSLKVRLALTAVSVIAASVAMTVYLVTRDTRQRAETSIKDSVLDVDTVSKTISSRLLNREQALQRAAAQWPAQAVADAGTAQAFLAQQAVLGVLFSRTFLASGADGRMLAASSEAGVGEGTGSIRGKPCFEKALQGQRVVVSEHFAGPEGAGPSVVLTVPVRDADGVVRAVLGGVLHPQTDSLLTDSTRASSLSQDPIETVITDAAGRIVSHPDPAWLQRDVGQDPRLAQAVARWRSQGAPLEPQAWAWRIDTQFIAMAAVPVADWMVFRMASADLLLGGPAAGRREAVWIGGGVAIAGALLILLATAWMLRPMQRLERRAMKLLDADLPVDSGWPEAGGEIGQLSDVFKHVVSERAQMQRSNDEMLARLRAVMHNAPVGIGFSRHGRLELVSRRLAALLGCPESALEGANVHQLLPCAASFEDFMAKAASALAAGRSYAGEVEIQRRDGRRFWAFLHAAAVSPGDPAGGVIWLLQDVSAQRAQREQLSWSATHDALTDLVNRREFEAQMQALLHERRRHGPASLLFIDLDRFKAVNDIGGHAAGDAMLRAVAQILARRVREGDTVARLGGDEFAVLLRNCERAKARLIAEQIRHQIAGFRLDWQDGTLEVGASIGVVEMDESLGDMAAVMAAADSACYAAKHAGRNAVRSHEPTGTAIH